MKITYIIQDGFDLQSDISFSAPVTMSLKEFRVDHNTAIETNREHYFSEYGYKLLVNVLLVSAEHLFLTFKSIKN